MDDCAVEEIEEFDIFIAASDFGIILSTDTATVFIQDNEGTKNNQ